MKKYLFLFCALAVCVGSMAQLRVNYDGHTTAGTMSIIKNSTDKTALEIITAGNDTLFKYSPSNLLSLAAEVSVYPIIHYSNEDEDPQFFVNGLGQVYSSQYVSFSDSIGKTNITPLDSSLEKLKRLRGVSYHFKDELKHMNVNDKMASTPEIREQMQKERGRKRMGLIAQEVEEVFPEAVRTQFNGKKGIIYTDFIGVLISAINEMDEKYMSQVEELQSQLNATRAVLCANGTLFQAQNPAMSLGSDYSDAVLYQNTPNPFNSKTTISYRLPSEIETAFICVYNLNGEQLKKFDLDISETVGSITLDASTFSVGMYIYALIIDGQMITSKRMILTD